MKLKNSLYERLNKDRILVFFIFLFFLVQIIFSSYFYFDLYQTLGYTSFSFFSFLIYFSNSLFIHLTLAIVLTFFLLLLGNWNKVKLVFISALEIFYLIFLYLDIRLYKILGVHLYDQSVLGFLNKDALKNDVLMNDNLLTAKVIIYSIIFFIALLLFSVLLYRLAKKLATSSKMLRLLQQCLAFSLSITLFAIFGTLKNYPIISTIPFYDVFNQDVNLEWIKVKYPTPIKDELKAVKKPNILLLLSESTRGDMMTPEIMPYITNYIEKNEHCIRSKRHFSGAHTTYPSMFSMIYGLYAYNNPFFNNQVTQTKPASLKLLKDLGYETVFLTASAIEGSTTLSRVTKTFDLYRFFKYEPHGQADMKMIQWFKQYYKKNKKPKFVILFMRSPHYAYDYPKAFNIHKPVIELGDKHLAFNSSYMSKTYRTELFNRYKNSVLFIDSLFKDVVEFTKEDKENLILFYSGDHGEEFWEKGKFGHFSTSFIKERVETPFLFCLPGVDRREVELSNNMDFFPTVFDYISGSRFKNLDKYFDGVSLLSKKALKNRYFIVSTHSFSGTNNKMCLVNKYGKLNIKYNSKYVSKISDFSIQGAYDFDDQVLTGANRQELFKSLEDFKKRYSRFFYLK